MPLTGKATMEGTSRYRERFPDFEIDFFSQNRWVIASIGIGTQGGGFGDCADRDCATAIVEAVGAGANLIDTASNYRFMRSEAAVAEALSQLTSQGIDRSEIVVATKGGFIPCGTSRHSHGQTEEGYLREGIYTSEDIVDGKHCLGPRFLQDQLIRSLSRLGLQTIDVYFLHNPEFQLTKISRAALEKRLASAFGSLEEEVLSGRIQIYGIATWTGLRIPSIHPHFLDLATLIDIAESVGGANHHFGAVQLPFSLAMPEALLIRNQRLNGRERVSVLEFCKAHNLITFASVPLAQGDLSKLSSAALGNLFPEVDEPVLKALQFARSTEGITSAVVGMTKAHHVRENLTLAKLPRAGADAIGVF